MVAVFFSLDRERERKREIRVFICLHSDGEGAGCPVHGMANRRRHRELHLVRGACFVCPEPMYVAGIYHTCTLRTFAYLFWDTPRRQEIHYCHFLVPKSLIRESGEKYKREEDRTLLYSRGKFCIGLSTRVRCLCDPPCWMFFVCLPSTQVWRPRPPELLLCSVMRSTFFFLSGTRKALASCSSAGSSMLFVLFFERCRVKFVSSVVSYGLD